VRIISEGLGSKWEAITGSKFYKQTVHIGGKCIAADSVQNTAVFWKFTCNIYLQTQLIETLYTYYKAQYFGLTLRN